MGSPGDSQHDTRRASSLARRSPASPDGRGSCIHPNMPGPSLLRWHTKNRCRKWDVDAMFAMMLHQRPEMTTQTQQLLPLQMLSGFVSLWCQRCWKWPPFSPWGVLFPLKLSIQPLDNSGSGQEDHLKVLLSLNSWKYFMPIVLGVLSGYLCPFDWLSHRFEPRCSLRLQSHYLSLRHLCGF